MDVDRNVLRYVAEEEEKAYYTMNFYIGSIIQYALALLTNGILFLLLWRTRRDFKTLGFGFVLVLAVSDFANALHRIPLTLFDMGAINEVHLSNRGDNFMAWFCSLTSSLTVFAPFVASLAATLLSIERYCFVCLSMPLNRKVGWLLFIGILGIFAIPTFVAAVYIGINLPKLWRLIRNHMYYVLLSMMLGGLTFCYINIYLTTKRNVMASSSSCSKPSFVTRRVAIRVFVFLGLYLFCYVPMVLTYATHMNNLGKVVPLEYIALIFNGFISLIDPILVLFLHRKYLEEFLTLVNSNRVTRVIISPNLRSYLTS
ncbi:hypothetical protein L0F63_005867 [Massospora cicadina]|nr:hypothetical protein L0F63_005867 [Massospora cicadina]